MRLVHALGAAVAATTLVSSVAQATLTMSLVPVAVNSTAAATIGSGQMVRTYQLKVTQNTEKFDVANLQVTLASGGGLSGYFYADPTVHDNAKAFNNSYLSAPTSPSFYDTYVTSPKFGLDPANNAANLAVTGSADWPVGPGTGTAIVPKNNTNTTAGNQALNIVWGDPQGGAATNNTNTAGNAASTYTVAQFTIVGNTGAYIRGYNGGSGSANVAQNFQSNAPLQTLPAGTMYLPELGDVNGDALVDQVDYDIWLANGGTGVEGGPVLLPQGDVDQNGIVDQRDYDNWLANGGHQMIPPASGVALGSVVPEPASLGLLSLAGIALASRRRRA